MINLENAQAVAQCAAIRVGVQPRAEHHKLTDAALHGGGQSILREARPHRDENSHPSSGWALLGLSGDGFGVFTQDAQSKWIGEDAAVFQHLMSGAVKGRRSSCPAWLSELHNRFPLPAPGQTCVVAGQASMFEPSGIGYSSSMFAGKGYLFFLSSSKTSFNGVSPLPHSTFGAWSFLRSLMCRLVILSWCFSMNATAS